MTETETEEKRNQYYAAKRTTQISNIIFDTIIFLVLAFVVVATVYPFWNTIAISFNDGLDALKGGITLWPRKFTWQNYQKLFITNEIFHASLHGKTMLTCSKQTVFSMQELFLLHVQFFRLYSAYSVQQCLHTL